MSDTPPARNQRWRARPWLWVLLLLVLAFTIQFYMPRKFQGPPQDQWNTSMWNFGPIDPNERHVRWNFRDWHFGSYETHQPLHVGKVYGVTECVHDAF